MAVLDQPVTVRRNQRVARNRCGWALHNHQSPGNWPLIADVR